MKTHKIKFLEIPAVAVLRTQIRDTWRSLPNPPLLKDWEGFDGPAAPTAVKRVARIAEDVGGWYVSDDALTYLDVRGHAHASRRSAVAALRANPGEYTHYLSPEGRRVKLSAPSHARK